jgi:hypothetical protein
MDLSKRVSKLEELRESLQPVDVIEARDGTEAEAADRYRARVPEPERAPLLVVVRRWLP